MQLPRWESSYVFYFFILVFCVIGGFLIHYSTDLSPWIVSDTVGYFEAAENLVAGRGLVLIKASGVSESLRFHTPFYPLVLSLGVLLGVELIQYTRLLSVFSFVFQIFILGFAGYRLSKKWVFPLILVLYVVTSPAFLFSFSGAMSEPLYFLLSIASIFSLQAFFIKNKRTYLIIACLLTSAVFLTRYIGISIVLSGGLALLLFTQGKFTKRFKASALYLTITSGSFFVFIISVLARGDSPGIYQSFNQSLWHELNPVRVAIVDELWTGFHLDSIFPWFQYRLKFAFLIFSLLLLIVVVIHSIRSRRKENNFVIHREFFFQSGLLFASIAFFSSMVISITYVVVRVPKPALNERVLLPIVYSSVFSVISFLFFLSTDYKKNMKRKIIINALLFLLTCNVIAGNIPNSWDLIHDLHENGYGYASPAWRDSDVLDAVKRLPDEVPLITNDTIAIQYYSGRRSYEIHEIYDRSLLRVPYKYGDNPNDNYNLLFRNEGAALVLFDKVKWQLTVLYEDRTTQILESLTNGLYVYFNGWDGNIYFYNEFHLE